MIKKIATQSIKVDLLEQDSTVIDIGCGYNFSMSRELCEMGCKVIGCDPNPRITDVFEHPNFTLSKRAVVVDESVKTIDLINYNGTESATTIMSQHAGFPFERIEEIVKVETTTIKNIMEENKMEQVDLIAFNAEGAEYDLLKGIDGPIAKQLSVSFHDFRNLNPYYPNNERYYAELFETLEKWYTIVQHKWHQQGCVPERFSWNYWDSLFILKEYV